MKTILAAVLGLFLFCSLAKADECITPDKFNSDLSQKGIHLLGSKAAATEKMAKVFNENRKRNGQPEAEISIFILGLVETQNDGYQVVAAIADRQGCVVLKSIAVFPLQNFVLFMQKAGVTIEDFVPFDGA